VALDPGAIEIRALSEEGAGIADTPRGARHVPFALPGEIVRENPGGLPTVLSASAQRRAPLCRHFGVCGGCVAQHMHEDLYAAWKRALVVNALRRHRVEAPVEPLLRIEPFTRRRATFSASRADGAFLFGYHRWRSHDVVPIHECPLLVEPVAAALPALRAVAELVGSREARVVVLATPAGLDVAVEAGAGRLAPGAAARLARIAASAGLARVSVDGVIIVERSAPVLRVAGACVVPPPGAFVQAVADAEAAAVSEVCSALQGARRIGDLFSGVGPFALALAERSQVVAIDANAECIATLASAARARHGIKPIATKVRDLFREPLSPRELADFDAVVLDPPRAGARAQCDSLARSEVGSIVYVACNAAALARDAAALSAAGYRIERVRPIDQFLFSAHVEAVAVLRRVGRSSHKGRRAGAVGRAPSSKPGLSHSRHVPS
jgi:23S rRNA (uracil1939-C5)-methyltransferase